MSQQSQLALRKALKKQIITNPPKDRRLRMIWNSNAVFVPSGYGVHQRDLLYRLLKEGWPTAQIAFTGLEGEKIVLNDLLIYPKMADTWGTDAMVFHSRHFQANVVFTMQDIWPLNPQGLEMLSKERPWIPYVPIDKDPVPAGVLDRLRYAYKIVTFSQFGQKALQKAGFTSTLIPESVDTNIFKPMDKIEARKFFNLPQNRFIVGMIGANKPDAFPRKGWQQALEAFKLFHDKHPEALYFYEVNQPGGFDIEGYAKYLEIEKDIFKIDQYLSIFHSGSEIVNKMLNSFDILLHPSTTEGFGLVVAEAQAAGIPVIVNRCTSMPELIIEGETGEICETGFKQWAPGDGYIYYPDTQSLYEKMEKLFVADRVKMGISARKHVEENYNIDKSVKEKWNPFLENLQKELLPQVDNSLVKT